MGKRSVAITLTPRQQEILEGFTRTQKATQLLVKRCPGMLLSVAGRYNEAQAASLALLHAAALFLAQPSREMVCHSRATIARTRQLFLAQGPANPRARFDSRFQPGPRQASSLDLWRQTAPSMIPLHRSLLPPRTSSLPTASGQTHEHVVRVQCRADGRADRYSLA